jgi:hypothetical protein
MEISPDLTGIASGRSLAGSEPTNYKSVRELKASLSISVESPHRSAKMAAAKPFGPLPMMATS